MKIINHVLCEDDGTPVPYKLSPNHGGDFVDLKFLLMHYTGGRSLDSSASWLCNPLSKASAHVIIGRDAKVEQLIPFNKVAWHAGVSSYLARDLGVRSDGTRYDEIFQKLNIHAIGLELDNVGPLERAKDNHGQDVWRSLATGGVYPLAEGIELTHKNEHKPCGWHVYPDVQLEKAFEVAHAIVIEYNLVDVLGHDDVAPGRKRDPGPAFTMDSFRSRLFGRADV